MLFAKAPRGVAIRDAMVAIEDSVTDQNSPEVAGRRLAQGLPRPGAGPVGRTDQDLQPTRLAHSHRSACVGVVFLEMILGTSDVFTVDQRTAAMIAHRMKRTAGVDDKKSSDAMLLAALADYCIYRREDSYEEDKDIRTGHDNENSQEVGSGLVNPNHSEVLVSPTGSTGDGDARLSVMAVRSAASTSQVLRNKRRRNERRTHQDLHPMVQSRVCGLEDLRLAILRRDPLGTGISDEWQLDLISRLLRWEPAERFSMADGKLG